jgi:hypothetical protein
MKYLIFTLIGLSSAHLFSQNLIEVFDDSINSGHEINISSFNYYSSNSFNNDLTNKFIYGGEITTEIKDFNQTKLGKGNALGLEAEQKFEYVNYNLTPFKKWSDLGLIFNIGDYNYASSNISSDLFNIAMYGNTNYKGDTMNFSFTHGQYLHLQKIGFGLVHKKSKSSLTLSYVSGNKSIDYRLGNTWMHTSPLTDSINFNLNAEGHYTDSTQSYFSAKGHGFSIDLNHNFMYLNKKDKRQIINFKLGNLGFVIWDKETNYNYIDSSQTYSGFDILNLINRDTSKALISSDTLGLYSNKSNQLELLPFELSIEKLADRYSDQKIQLIYGFKSIISSDYKPYLFVGAYYSPNQKIGVSSRLAYGGFGGFKFGLNANYWIKDKFSITLGSQDLVGFISNKHGYGKSLNFTTRIKF